MCNHPYCTHYKPRNRTADEILKDQVQETMEHIEDMCFASRDKTAYLRRVVASCEGMLAGDRVAQRIIDRIRDAGGESDG